jgi:hypothetical protein
MSDLGNVKDWLPLSAALIWVASGDSAKVHWAIKHPDGKRYAADTWESGPADSATAQSNEQDALGEQNAWLKLRSAIASEKVSAWGFPYQEEIAVPPPRAPAISFAWARALSRRGSAVAPYTPVAKRLVAPPVNPSEWTIEDGAEEDEEEEDMAEPTKSQLPATEVKNLVLGGIGRLRRADWAILGGQGWHSVVISRMDLAAAFPVDANPDDEGDEGDHSPRDEGPEDVDGLSFAARELDWKARRTREAIMELGFQRVRLMNSADRKTKVEERVREKLIASAEKENHGPVAIERAGKVTIGYSTINRIIANIAEGK